jgi:hypothetical protein
MRAHTVEAPKKFEKSMAITKVRQFLSSVCGSQRPIQTDRHGQPPIGVSSCPVGEIGVG